MHWWLHKGLPGLGTKKSGRLKTQKHPVEAGRFTTATARWGSEVDVSTSTPKGRVAAFKSGVGGEVGGPNLVFWARIETCIKSWDIKGNSKITP